MKNLNALLLVFFSGYLYLSIHSLIDMRRRAIVYVPKTYQRYIIYWKGILNTFGTFLADHTELLMDF